MKSKPGVFIVVLFTTLYREGGPKFKIAAEILAREKRLEFPEATITCAAVESKKDFAQHLTDVAQVEGKILELHFIGHSGLYGIMFGTTKWPEQLSPFEWRNLTIPFCPDARAYFHACRTGRWFAPFFARTFNVKAFGHFWYTTISTHKDKFIWDATKKERPLFVISVAGKKSHGLFGAVKKYLLQPAKYPLREFSPQRGHLDTTYDSVAPLYDQTFEDICVRKDELKWLRRELRQLKPEALLDIGCGTGSFLRAVADLVGSADGVDISSGMITHAKKRSESINKLKFSTIDGPILPFADNSFDVVSSVLSFRYLDWDPIVQEILRVLKPGGRLLVIDMVAAPLSAKNIPVFMFDKMRSRLTHWRNPVYRQSLKRMVTDPRWQKMLEYNPIRAEHELKWYLESRFPGEKSKILNYAWHSRILAFRSPPIYHKNISPMAYP